MVESVVFLSEESKQKARAKVSQFNSEKPLLFLIKFLKKSLSVQIISFQKEGKIFLSRKIKVFCIIFLEIKYFFVNCNPF